MLETVGLKSHSCVELFPDSNVGHDVLRVEIRARSYELACPTQKNTVTNHIVLLKYVIKCRVSWRSEAQTTADE